MNLYIYIYIHYFYNTSVYRGETMNPFRPPRDNRPTLTTDFHKTKPLLLVSRSERSADPTGTVKTGTIWRHKTKRCRWQTTSSDSNLETRIFTLQLKKTPLVVVPILWVQRPSSEWENTYLIIDKVLVKTEDLTKLPSRSSLIISLVTPTLDLTCDKL